jgi:UDP-N-acetylmuramoylalanine--D-glutamate ligase
MDYTGKKVLIMGLGLHGGGLQSARYLLKKGAEITVTDLRDEKTLLPSIEQLGSSAVRYVLGKHEIEDFKKADIVIKNPGVRPDSPFLKAAKQVETDLSLFLAQSPARLFAVTGSKGKSSTSSALHWVLDSQKSSHGGTGARRVFFGGNITVSPLSFLEDMSEGDDVVLELSSFQLGDLKGRLKEDGSALLKPAAAVITTIMPDHLDRYASMKEYVDDKRNIYRGQDSSCVTVAGDDSWGESFRSETKGRPLVYSRSMLGEGLNGGWIDKSGMGLARLKNWDGINGEIEALVPDKLLTPGEHQKANLLSAALAAYSLGVKAQDIFNALSSFPGVEHRLELFCEEGGIRFYNDSAATIPEAAAACIEALSAMGPLVLVTGGTDKNLDYSPLVNTADKAAAIVLLAGTGSDKLVKLLGEEGIDYSGPFDNLDNAVRAALDKACGLKNGIVALSPGCASFGMFLNEFDRGRKWKESVKDLTRVH